MAVADYVTKDELDALEKRLTDTIAGLVTKADIAELATKADIRAEANRVIEAIQRGTNPNF